MAARILLFGYGNLASAMLAGWLASGIEPEHFVVYNPRPKPVPPGIAFTATVPDRRFDTLVLCVKPQQLEAVTPAVRALTSGDTLLVSVLAGVNLGDLATRFPEAGGHARMIPNLAAALGQSATVLVGPTLDVAQRAAVTDLALRLGSAEWIEDEAQTDLVTALTASGPGFTYRFIAAMAAGAAELGLDPAQAKRLAVQMVAGAGALASASEDPPEVLAGRVASPGGMTQAGFDVLDREAALADLMRRCLAAAADRSRELGQLPHT